VDIIAGADDRLVALETLGLAMADGRAPVAVGTGFSGMRLWGNPIVAINKLPSIDTGGSKSIFFGVWRNFALRDVRSVELFPFQERYRHKRQIGHMAWGRFDGRPLFPATIAAGRLPLKAIRTTT